MGWTFLPIPAAVVVQDEATRSLSRLTQFTRLRRVMRRYGDSTRSAAGFSGTGTISTEIVTTSGTGTISIVGTGTIDTQIATSSGSGSITNPPAQRYTQFHRLLRVIRRYGDSSREIGEPSGIGTLSTQITTASGTGTVTGIGGDQALSTTAATVAGTGVFTASPTITITSPTGGATVYNNAVLTGTASANGSATVTLVEWSLNQTTWSSATGTTSWTATMPTQTSGSKTFYVRVTDSLGAIGTNNVTVTMFAFGVDIAAENALTGTALSLFSGMGTDTTQGFARGFSFAPGDTVDLCGIVGGSQVTFEVYRLGYYAGNLSRLIQTFTGTPTSQPAPTDTGNTRAQHCNAWTAIAQWRVPDDALPGMYMVKMYRTDATTQGCNILMCVHSTTSRDIGYMTGEFTWHLAYGSWGTSNTRNSGRSLYGTNDAFNGDSERAARVYYDRPTTTRGASAGGLTRFWRCEMATIAFLERNGYDVGYCACKDVAGSSGATMLGRFGTLVISGHNEYWSQEMRDRVQTRIDAGMNLFSLSGNTCFWRVLYNATDRYIECWKETENDSVKIGVSGQVWGTQPTDSSPPSLWTGTWRDDAAAATDDPENRLLGSIFIQNNDGNDNITVGRSRFQNHRAWANTSVSSSSTGTVTFTSLLGFEVDTYAMPSGQGIDSSLVTSINATRPPGLILLSEQSVTTTEMLKDDGDSYSSGTYSYGFVLRKTSGGGIVFATGSMNTSWGLYNFSDGDVGDVTNTSVKQLAVNVLAEMGAQPDTLEGTLVSASASGDTTGPTVTITSHINNQAIGLGTTTPVISGTASTTGGVVAGIEYNINSAGWVALDPSTPTSWSFTSPTLNNNTSNTISVRGVDDWGNIGTANTITLFTQPYTATSTLAAQTASPSGTGAVVQYIGTSAVTTEVATTSGSGGQGGNVGAGAANTEIAAAAGTGSNISFIGSSTLSVDAATAAGTGSNISFIGSSTLSTDVSETSGAGANVSYIGTGAVDTQQTTVVSSGTVVAHTGSGTVLTQTATTAGSGVTIQYISSATISTEVAASTGSGTNVSFIGNGVPTTSVSTSSGIGANGTANYEGSGEPSTQVVTTSGAGTNISFIGSSSITNNSVTGAGSGNVVSYTASVTLGTQITTSSGSGTVIQYIASGTLDTQPVTTVGSGAVLQHIGTSTIQTQLATTTGSGSTNVPSFSATGAITLQQVTNVGTGNNVSYMASVSLQTLSITTVGTGVLSNPAVAGSGVLITNNTTATGTGTIINIYLGAGNLTTERATAFCFGFILSMISQGYWGGVFEEPILSGHFE